jgi:chloride channel protein, CIC family
VRAAGIAVTFNAPVTGAFFGMELILREFLIDALLTVMIADVVGEATPV